MVRLFVFVWLVLFTVSQTVSVPLLGKIEPKDAVIGITIGLFCLVGVLLSIVVLGNRVFDWKDGTRTTLKFETN